MKALATIAMGSHAALLRRSEPTFRAYAARHGYEFVVGDGSMPEPRAPSWAKVPLLRGLLDTHEVVLWVDADAMILDSSEDVAELLPDAAFQGLVFDVLGPNAGVWLLRSCDQARAFLEEVWTVPIDDSAVNWWDNAAVLRLLGWSLDSWPPTKTAVTEWDAGTAALPDEWNRRTIWNSDWRTARIHHLAGERHLIRLTVMEADVQHLRGNRVRAAVLRAPWRLAVWLRGLRSYGRLKGFVMELRA